MKKKKIAIIVIVIAVILTASIIFFILGSQNKKISADNPKIITNGYSGTDEYILENIGNLLCYWDVKQSVTAPVCANPDCSHERSTPEKDSECTARLPNEQNYICAFYYNNYLYVFASNGLNGFIVYKSDYDGRNRKTFYTDKKYSLTYTDNMCLYNGKLVFNGSVENYNEETNTLDSTSKILSFDLEKAELKELADFSDSDHCSFGNFGIYDNKLFYSRMYQNKDSENEKYFSVAESLDLTKGIIKKLFDADHIYDFDDGKIYYSESGGKDPAVYCYYCDTRKDEKLFETDGYIDSLQASGEKIYYGVCTSKDLIFDENNIYTVRCYDRSSKKNTEFKQLPADHTYQLSNVTGDLVMFYSLDLATYTGNYAGISVNDLTEGNYKKLYISKYEEQITEDKINSDSSESVLEINENGFVSFDVEDDNEIYDEYYKDKIKLVYLTDYMALKNTDSDYIQNQVNKYLDSKGYNFAVEFKNNNEFGTGETDAAGNPIMYPNISVYEDMLAKNEQVDILCTGAGMGKDFYSDGYMNTFNVCVEKGYLEPLNEYFDTELGSKWYDQFPENYWCVTTSSDGKIYGSSKMYCGACPSGLMFTSDKSSKYLNYDADSIYDLDNAMRSISDDTDFEALIMPKESEYYETLVGLINYNGIYFSPEENRFINIFEDESCKEYFSQIEKWRNDGLITSNDLPLQRENALGIIAESNPIIQKSICIGQGYVNSNNVNMGVGISSRSQHKKEAFELLALLNTDKELANLICLGTEGRNYVMVDGVPVINSKARPYYGWMDTMVNPLICDLYSENSEQCILQCKESKKSPLNNFDANINDISDKYAKVQEINNNFYSLFCGIYGEYETLDTALSAANDRLKAAGIDEVLNELNKQYNEFKQQ